jgi:hypothetical protein
MMNKIRFIFWLAIAGIALISVGLALGREETPIDKLTVGGAIINCEFVDLGNDRVKEALIFYDDQISGAPSRRMAVFAIEKKRYTAQPRQIIDLDRSVACFDLADIDGDGDQDLLLMTNKGIFAHLYEGDYFSLAMTDIVRDTTIFGTGAIENIVRWEFAQKTDTGSNNLTLFIPTLSGFDTYQSNRGKYEYKQTLKYEHISSVGGRAAYDNYKPMGFRIGCSFPAIVITDYNGDKLPDIFIIDNRAVSIFKRNFDGRFDREPSEIFGNKLLSYDERRLGKTSVGFDIYDLNRDGIADIVVTKNAGDVTNYQTSVQIFKGKPNGGYNLTSGQQFSAANGASNPYIYDLNQDGRLDLIIPSLKLGFMSTLKILLLKSVEVSLAVYLQNQADEFAEKPDYLRDYSYEVDINQNIDYSGILSLEGDYNGDGRNDLLIHEGDGLLKAYVGAAKGVFEGNPYREVQIVRPDGISVMDLNGDNQDEIIAHYLYNSENCNSVRVIW